jgi:hypothetical protein
VLFPRPPALQAHWALADHHFYYLLSVFFMSFSLSLLHASMLNIRLKKEQSILNIHLSSSRIETYILIHFSINLIKNKKKVYTNLGFVGRVQDLD